MLRLALILLVLAIAVPPAESEASAPFAPSSVMAEAAGPRATLLEWAPGSEPADHYRVYGIDGAMQILLLDTSRAPSSLVLAAVVPSGYDTYAVSGVKHGAESVLVPATSDVSASCFKLQVDPPRLWDKCRSTRPYPISFHYPVL